MSTRLYTHTHMHVCVCIYIYIYITSTKLKIEILQVIYKLKYLTLVLLPGKVNRITEVINVRGLSGKYPAMLNISRTVRLTLMYLGSQSEETLLRICEQSHSRGASQSAVRRR